MRNSLIRPMSLILLCSLALCYWTVCEGDTLGRSECKCGRKQFACATTSHITCTCVPIEWKCDSDNDCGDHSDEVDCVKPSCPSEYFRCSNGMCIPNKWVCDGANDCMDDSDEISCPVVECDKATERKCDTHSCILESWWCDGDEDCPDASDEKHCQSTCNPTDFICDNKDCIIAEWRCDKDYDCKDGSDEDSCKSTDVVTVVIGQNITCAPDEFACTGEYGECARREFVCDGDEDCSDGSDELLCDYTCTLDEFRCSNGVCIPLSSRCDEYGDCGDDSDEIGCPDGENESCMESEFQCTSGLCISEKWRCDNDQDCDDNSDEADCVPGSCSRNQFQCKINHLCIDLSWKCDGQPDCDDKSDELECDKCTDDQFQCGDGRCVGIHKLCDGHPDCGDRSDEPPAQQCDIVSVINNQSLCSSNNGGCHDICHDTPRGAICPCRRGFKKAPDGHTCIDINECLIEISCSQICLNTNGSYTCSCKSGYVLRRDGRTCKANGPEPTLLFANRIDIRKMQPDRSELKPILRDLENAIALDYHIEDQLMFWSDVTLDRIKSSHMNGSNVKEIVTSGLESPGGIAVDWIHDLLYWTDSGTSRLEVSQLDGKYRKVLIWNQLEKPRAIALHPLESLMFWTDWGASPRIESAWMDGNGRKTIASTNMHWPNGLAVDYTRNHVYWVDAKHHIIERANTDGKNRKAVISRGLPHPFAITIFEDKLYWTDWETKSINTANKFTGSSRRTIRNRLHFPMGIQTYHPQRQPRGESKCTLSSCSQLCLPRPSGFTCACKTGFRLMNSTHCAEDINEFLIFVRKSEIRRISYDADNHSDTVLPLKKLESAVALDWDGEYPGYIYWSDVGTDTISRANWDGNHQQEVVTTSLDSPAGIAVDWITRKLYWTDAGLNRIEVSLLDGTLRCVLIWTELDRPRDILVFPKKGYLFWTDWGEYPKIERSSMDGSNRFSLVEQGLKVPNGLAVDSSDERLYWADGGENVIMSCNLDGGDPNLIVTDNLPHPFGLALHGDRIYWTDWNLDMIQSANKYTGEDRVILREKLGYLMDIQYYHKNRAISPNPCKHRNGGCSHLCLLKEHSDPHSSARSFSCACPTGFALGKDGKNCNGHMEKFLIVARRTDIRVISLDVPYSADVKLSMQASLVNVIDVAFDPIEGYLYWSDIGDRHIARSHWKDLKDSEDVFKYGLGTVDGLAIDVIERKLYWTDADRELIAVSELNGSSRKTLVYDGLDSPRAIVVNHKTGYLFWSDWGNTPKIERIGMDGTARSVIADNNLMWPNGLTVDEEQNILIWGDANTELIECCDMNGGDRRTLRASVQHPYSLTAMDGYLYWTDWQTRNVERMNIRNTSDFTTMRKNLPNLMGLKAITANKTKTIEETKQNRKCENHGCSHLCLRSPTTDIGYRCACPTGILLQSDGKTCDVLPSSFLLFTSRNAIRRLSLDTDKETYIELPIPGLENVIAIDYHFESKRIFFTDVFMDVIRSANMDGSDARTVVGGDLRTMDGVAVDWVADHLYWTDTGPNVISVAKLDGSKRKILIRKGLDEPRAISLLPSKGKMFWTDWGAKPLIESAYLDGTNRKILVAKDIVWPNGLTIDVSGEGRIFWVDAHSSLQRIDSCDLDGRRRRTVIPHVMHGFSITFINNKLYWTDWQTHAIEVGSSLSDITNRSKVISDIDGLMDIKAVSGDHQRGTNDCDVKKGYGNCPELCLMRGPDSFVCLPPDPLLAIHTTTPHGPPQTSINNKLYNTSTFEQQPTLAVINDDLGNASTRNTGIYLLGIMLSILILVIFAISVIGFLLWRRFRSKRRRSHTEVSYRNHGYNTCSQNTLETGTNRNSPRLNERTPWLQVRETEQMVPTIYHHGKRTTSNKQLRRGETFAGSASRVQDRCKDRDRPKSNGYFARARESIISQDGTEYDAKSLSSLELEVGGEGKNKKVKRQKTNGGKDLANEKRLFRKKHEKQPKISVITTVTLLSVGSESDTPQNCVPSSTTSSSRVSTPDILNNFEEDSFSTDDEDAQLNKQSECSQLENQTSHLNKGVLRDPFLLPLFASGGEASEKLLDLEGMPPA